MKFVKYGKVCPAPTEVVEDKWLNTSYRWLGYYCGYYPQVWLSRSQNSRTGFRSKYSAENDAVMFGFESIKGFPLDFDTWSCTILNSLIDRTETDKDSLDQFIFDHLDSHVRNCQRWGDPLSPELKFWNESDKDIQDYLNKYLFVENNQVVVPSLNLKSAKRIVCRNERQKKKLKKMGFIDDRIFIRNVKTWQY
jgi:hypothetical protein